MWTPKVLSLKHESVWIGPIDPYIRIDRLTPWGNPFIIGIHGERDTVIEAHIYWLNRWIIDNYEIKMRVGARDYSNKWVIENIKILKGNNLLCWCAPNRCHGDTLLKLANVE